MDIDKIDRNFAVPDTISRDGIEYIDALNFDLYGVMIDNGNYRRLPDEVDKKIAYVELTDEMAAKYKTIVEHYTSFVGKVIAYMGVHKMDKLLALVDEFRAAVENACEDCQCEENGAKN